MLAYPVHNYFFESATQWHRRRLLSAFILNVNQRNMLPVRCQAPHRDINDVHAQVREEDEAATTQDG